MNIESTELLVQFTYQESAPKADARKFKLGEMGTVNLTYVPPKVRVRQRKYRLPRQYAHTIDTLFAEVNKLMEKLTDEQRLNLLAQANDLQAQLADCRTDLEDEADAEKRYQLTCRIDDIEQELKELYAEIDAEEPTS